MEVLTVHQDGGRQALPIFSHQEEAELFLWFDAPGADWRAREITAGELVSLFGGACAGVGEVALDPLPLFGDGAMAGLVFLLREDFVRALVTERESPALHQSPRKPGAPASSKPDISIEP